MWDLKDFSDGHWRGDSRSSYKSYKAEKTEGWAQARVLVSRAATATYRKLGDLKQQKFIISVLEAMSPRSSAGKAVLSLKAPGENPSFQPLVFAGLPCVP